MKKRREILEAAGLGSAALMAAMTMAPGAVQAEALAAIPEEAPKHHIRFAVCGISHDHIQGMISAVQRGGGELVSWWGAEPDKRAEFVRRYPNAKAARTQDEVLHDPSVQLVLSSQIASERAAIGMRAMQAARISCPTSPASPPWMTWPGCERLLRRRGVFSPSCIPNGWKCAPRFMRAN